LRVQDRRLAAQDGDAVPGLLAAPQRVVAGLAQFRLRECLVGGLQFLQADDVGPRALQPGEQVRQAAVDVVDVEGGDLHRR
jgi:hypothetical protein